MLPWSVRGGALHPTCRSGMWAMLPGSCAAAPSVTRRSRDVGHAAWHVCGAALHPTGM